MGMNPPLSAGRITSWGALPNTVTASAGALARTHRRHPVGAITLILLSDP
jgi:hypothetical protein